MSWNVGVLGSCAVSHLRAFVSARSPRSPQSLVRERPRAARVSWRGDQARAAFGLLQPVQRAGRGGLIPGWVLEAGPRGEQALAHSARSGRPGHQSSHPLLEVIGVRQVCPFANEDRLVITDALGTAAYMATAGGTRPAARCHGPLFKVCRRRLLRDPPLPRPGLPVSSMDDWIHGGGRLPPRPQTGPAFARDYPPTGCRQACTASASRS